MQNVNTEFLLSIIGEQQVAIRLLQKEILALREQVKPKPETTTTLQPPSTQIS